MQARGKKETRWAGGKIGFKPAVRQQMHLAFYLGLKILRGNFNEYFKVRSVIH